MIIYEHTQGPLTQIYDHICANTRMFNTNVQGVSKKSEFSRNWLQEILPGSVRNPVGIIRTNPALLQYVSHFIHHLECVGYMQILFSQFSLGFQQTVTRLGHNYITCDKIPILGNPIVSLVSE